MTMSLYVICIVHEFVCHSCVFLISNFDPSIVYVVMWSYLYIGQMESTVAYGTTVIAENILLRSVAIF